MKLYYPLALDLKRKTIFVVGGGQVAERKIKTLLEFGAKVRVVSPDLTRGLKQLVKSRRLTWLKNKIKFSDIKKADIVIAATSVPDINFKISKWCKRSKALINVVDRAKLSSFISPAVFKTSKAIIAVYTQGRDPVLSRDLKNFLKEHWNEFLSYRNKL